MHDVHTLLIQLFTIFVAAQLGGEIAVRLKMPSVVGEIAGGIAVGPYALKLIPVIDGHAPLPFEMLAEIGVVFLMFHVGLETPLRSLRKLGRVAIYVALLGVALPFALGVGWGWTQGFEFSKQAFIGTAFVATSVAITARVLGDLKALQRKESRVVLAAAVLDDILAMLLLGAVAALQPSASAGGASPIVGLVLLAVQALAFLLALTVFLPKLVRRHHRLIDAPRNTNSPFILALALCLGISVLAVQIGLAAIIGAFLAGTLLAEIGEEYNLEKQLKPVLIFLSPFFFVVTGMKVDISVFARPEMVLALLVVTALAFIGKVVGCGFAARKLGTRSALIIGIGMSPRGEVGIIIAALGLGLGIFDQDVYALIIGMSILTSIIAPPLLAHLLKKGPTEETTPLEA